MSVHPTIRTPRGLAVAGSIIASLALTSAASAAEPGVTYVAGNPNCAVAGANLGEVKVDPVPEGRHAFGDGTLRGVVDVRGVVFSFTAEQGVDAVIVKGGPDANLYRASREVTTGQGLHAPINPDTGRPYGLSHITFCYDDGADPADPTDPKDPKDPTDPTDPTDPKDPKDPTDPTDPKDPADPTDPKDPADPTDPTDPKDPADPRQPGPCEPGGPATMPDGRPCTATPATPAPGPCQPGGPVTMPSGEPCAPPAAIAAAAPPQGEVLGAAAKRKPKPVAAAARMSRPRRCVSATYTQVVRGKGIKRVVVSVNGRRVRSFAGGRSSYAVRIDPRAYPSGVMRVSARVVYVAASGKRPQTLRSTVLRCAARQAPSRPSFAG